MSTSLALKTGDWVEVRSREEILETLDENGRLDRLPFMPEMFAFCGRRVRVFRRAHKTCDPPSGMDGRRMNDAVHLEDVRCDGESHGGCQHGCLIFWKEAWLKRVDGPGEPGTTAEVSTGNPSSNGHCTVEAVERATRKNPDAPESEEALYACQSTDLFQATHALAWYDVRQYFEDYRSGNVGLGQMAATFLFFLYHGLASAGLGLGSFMRGAYDMFQRLRGGSLYPWRFGEVPKGTRTPTETLGLQEGEMVRIKAYKEILKTLDEKMRNRGMYFDGEEVPFCEDEFRVQKLVTHIIDEKTGKMIVMKTPSVILEGVYCTARYSKCRRFCPRSIYPFWREIWLERVEKAENTGNEPA